MKQRVQLLSIYLVVNFLILCFSTSPVGILQIKFIYSEKATIICEISTVDLSYVVMVKSTVEISKNFVAFSEYMNFKIAEFFNNSNRNC